MKPQKIHIICLPYSGGSAFAFQPLAEYWPKSWKVTTLSFPGRGRRIDEPLVYSMEELVNDCWDQIKENLNQPYVLFGHSLGSTLAFLLAHKALENNTPLPMHLFFSGTKGPSALIEKPYRYLFNKEDFKAKLQSYGGISEEILNDDVVFDFFGNIIRADFQAVETWQYAKQPLLDIPATVINGTKEEIAESDIQLWQKEFLVNVDFVKLEGNHFFLFAHAKEFVEILQKHLENTIEKYNEEALHESRTF